MRGNVQRSAVFSKKLRRLSLSPLLTLLLGFVIGLLASWYWWQMLVEPVFAWEPKLLVGSEKLLHKHRKNFTVESYLNPSNPIEKVLHYIGYSDSEIGYLGRKTVLLGVVTSEKYLMTRAKTVFDTWGKKVDNIVFFVGAGCKTDRPELINMKFVKLPVPDNEYPPQKKVFAMLKYMAANYIDQYHWFVRADDDVYIRHSRLQEVLSKLDPSKELYIGHPGNGRPIDQGRLKLEPNEAYCLGGPGVLLSRELLKALDPNLNFCLDAVDHYNSKSFDLWYNEDVELGRCISRTLNIQCSALEGDRNLFYQDYHSNNNDVISLWYMGSYRQALSIHPVKDPYDMLRIHHFFAVLDFSKAATMQAHNREELNRICKLLLQSSVSPMPPWLATEICHGDVVCGCGDETVRLANVTYHFHMGQVGIANEDTWVHYLSESDLKSGVVQYQMPSICSHYLPHLHEINVTGYLKYIDHFILSDSVSVNVKGGLVHYGWLTGMQVFIHAFPVYPTPHRKMRKFDGYFSFQFITQLPTKVIVAQERIRYTSNKLLNVIIVVDSEDPHIDQFITDHLKLLPNKKSSMKVLLMVMINKEKIRKINTRRNSNIAVTYGKGQFSWEKGVEVALKRLSHDSIVFVSDVKLNIKEEFVDRCNKFSSSERLYFPIPIGCPASESNCFGSGTGQTCRLACGYMPKVRDWFDSVRYQSSLQSSYRTTAVDSSLYVRNPEDKCCS